MTDHDALLAAILADPAEDTPRLIYADYLDENAGETECPGCSGAPPRHSPAHGFLRRVVCGVCGGGGRVADGRAARAEFIRVQVELSAAVRQVEADRKDPWKGCCDRYADRMACNCLKGPEKLRRRERELLERHWHDWSGRVATYCGNFHDSAGGCGVTFRRGFVCEWKGTAEQWLAHADSLVWRPGATTECPECRGWPSRGVQGKTCPTCVGERRVPRMDRSVSDRPLPPTAQPIERVTLTTVPLLQSGDTTVRVVGRETRHRFADLPRVPAVPAEFCAAVLAAEWPGITFTLEAH